MPSVDTAKRAPTVPLVLAVLVCAGLALLLESQLKLSLRLPGHRAFPAALALVLLARTVPRAALIGFAAVVGALIAAVSANPLLALVWLAPAVLLAGVQPRPLAGRAAVAVGAGLALGLLRYLALAGSLHHTPDAVRLAGHLAFGALGSLGVAFELRGRRRGNHSQEGS